MSWYSYSGNTSPSFNSISDRDSAYPTPTEGQKVLIKRFCGNGYFEMCYCGTSWEVAGGQYIILDRGPGGSGYPIVGTSATVVVASYTIPANFITNSSLYFLTGAAKHTGTFVSGNDFCRVRVAGNGVTQAFTNGANGFGTFTGSMQRVGTKSSLALNSAFGANNAVLNVTDLSQSFVIELTLTPANIAHNITGLICSVQRGIA